jgi:hypothetical protein
MISYATRKNLTEGRDISNERKAFDSSSVAELNQFVSPSGLKWEG